MRLTPKQPPGRLNRKALAFEPEIARLHVQGYSCEAIRQALADVGLVVSRSTVAREITRQTIRKQGGAGTGATTNVVADTVAMPPSELKPPSAPAMDPRSGKEIAASWMKGRTANPLFRTRTS